ncbi:MAG: TrmH family RNA methyltransferase [Bacteroidetes bacterium]|nr:MAG: TrmH family RNA methyltransferase [Bacteroidota bacterium]
MSRKLKNIELNRLSREDFKEAEKIPMVLVLEDIRSMSNVGSLFRTADSFRLEKLFLCGITGTPPHKEIRKTALGADESMAWEKYEDAVECIHHLKAQGYVCYALEQAEEAHWLHEFEARCKIALVLGSEVDGVSQEAIDACNGVIEIAQYGTKHSLNVAVAGGIATYQIATSLLSDGTSV